MGGEVKKENEEMVKEKKKAVVGVNKMNESMIHKRPAESEKVEQWEREKDSVRGLQKVTGRERQAREKQKIAGA